MIEGNELVLFIIAFISLMFILLKIESVKTFPLYKMFLLSYFILLLGFFFTTFEEIYFSIIFNILEHICYLISSIILFYWIWKVFVKGGVINWN